MPPQPEPIFVGRTSELAVLEELADSGRPEFFVLYGRRRVGKTELLQKLCAGRRSVYFLAAQVRDRDNLRGFRDALREGLGGDTLIEGIEFPDWYYPPTSAGTIEPFDLIVRRYRISQAV